MIAVRPWPEEATLIPEVLRRRPQSRAVLDRYGLNGCGGPEGPVETLGFFARAHDGPLHRLLAELSAVPDGPRLAVLNSARPGAADAIYRPFFKAGIAVVLTLGAVWGAYLLLRIALVGETLADVRRVMIEGVSGLLAIHGADEAPELEASKSQLVWPNGSIAQMFSAEDPDSLRGPQFDAAWCDELAKWRRPEETWDMLQFGMRLGESPAIAVTTTPRPASTESTMVRRAASRPTSRSGMHRVHHAREHL